MMGVDLMKIRKIMWDLQPGRSGSKREVELIVTDVPDRDAWDHRVFHFVDKVANLAVGLAADGSIATGELRG